MASQSDQALTPRDHRDKTASEYDIEARWREVLLHGASAEDFQRAYDELHGEFLRRQGGDGEIYDEVNPRSGTEDRIRAVALRCIGSGARVLEIGAGDGRTAYLLAKQGNKVLSVDVSRLALERARARWGGEPGLGLAYEFGDARHLDLPAGSFDYIVSENLVEHISLKDMQAHLREVYRLLAPGGAYLLYTPSRLWSGRVSAGFHLHVYTLRELCDLMCKCGLEPRWLEPRLLHRTGRLWMIGGLGLRLGWAYESFLRALCVHKWSVALKARIIPSIMVCGRKKPAGGSR